MPCAINRSSAFALDRPPPPPFVLCRDVSALVLWLPDESILARALFEAKFVLVAILGKHFALPFRFLFFDLLRSRRSCGP